MPSGSLLPVSGISRNSLVPSQRPPLITCFWIQSGKFFVLIKCWRSLWLDIWHLEFVLILSLLVTLLLSHFSCVRLCATPSLGFSRQEHWSGLPFPSPVHKSESEVAQSCLILSDSMDCSLPGSSVHGIFQARVLEWVAISFSRGSSWSRDQTRVSHIVRQMLYCLSHQGSPILVEMP